MRAGRRCPGGPVPASRRDPPRDGGTRRRKPWNVRALRSVRGRGTRLYRAQRGPSDSVTRDPEQARYCGRAGVDVPPPPDSLGRRIGERDALRNSRRSTTYRQDAETRNRGVRGSAAHRGRRREAVGEADSSGRRHAEPGQDRRDEGGMPGLRCDGPPSHQYTDAAPSAGAGLRRSRYVRVDLAGESRGRAVVAGGTRAVRSSRG